MKKVTFALAGVMGFSATLAWAGTADLDAKFKEMIDRSFKTLNPWSPKSKPFL